MLVCKWRYRRRRGQPGETVLETAHPSPQRLLVPPIEALHAEGFRRLVDEVAEHKGAPRGAVLWSMLRPPKGVVRPGARGDLQARGGIRGDGTAHLVNAATAPVDDRHDIGDSTPIG